MTAYVLSTMTAGVNYTFYHQTSDLPVERKKIFIAGGRGIPSVRSGFGEMQNSENGTPIWTAAGMVTPISESDYNELKDHHVFKKHLEKGLVKVLNTDITGNHKAVIKHSADMSEDGFGLFTTDKLKRNIKVTTAAMRENDEFRL